MRGDADYLRLAVGIARQSREDGNHPFGALLVGPDGEVLLSSGNTFAVDGGPGHAEANVAREAARRFDPAFLAGCTLVTSVEPCCMCAGACYWAGIGAVVYGMSERRLAELLREPHARPELPDRLCRRTPAGGRARSLRGA